ncbi:fumarylacetoacetate hydrolase [Nakamurella antarctica]|uniref:Fumarylacetoacetate hydrolase n=1 Tax=Nakamurella antarctica TaxID=1902245 RepID=A0A3G8ZJC0_9ACTN|nr:fumarylacetoacetate hydrolase family protein [Nakamurella antarctica]AZI56935.1 fumarylacetoacetate hydrolase [Nakamurella antarctica]
MSVNEIASVDGTVAKVVIAGEADPAWVLSQGAQWHRLPADTSLASLLALSSADLASVLASPHPKIDLAANAVELCPPVDTTTEIWAAGVTYLQSQQARTAESAVPDVYDRVYEADRPELFFKSIGWKASGPGDPVAVRDDSGWNVPEPELALVVNSRGEIVALTICNDVSSRSIEGENPLYLPQAKVYLGSCAIGPWLVPVSSVDPHNLEISMTITRDGAVIWSDRTSTAKLKRTIQELVDALFTAAVYPEGAILSTGTCLVPADPFTLMPGDSVEISIEGIGTLTNLVLATSDSEMVATIAARRPNRAGGVA